MASLHSYTAITERFERSRHKWVSSNLQAFATHRKQLPVPTCNEMLPTANRRTRIWEQ